jgi:hypothetical protein
MQKNLIITLSIFICLVICSEAFSQEKLTEEIKKQTIDTLCSRLPERYAYKEVSAEIIKLLKQNLQNGKYINYTSFQDFSKAVTKDLRSQNNDRHLALNYDLQQNQTATANTNSQPPNEKERIKKISMFNRQMNYGFQNVTFYPGNIGYIKFNYFDAYQEYSQPQVDAAFGFLKNSDALILDLRNNTGGSSAMVSYILGFFFSATIQIGTSYNRYTDSTTAEYVQPAEESKRLLNSDLYILTSNVTVSAAEALAYNLKYLKNAIIIGETSTGAANPGRVTRLNPYYTAFIPNRHASNIVTKTNWEGTGVPVNIKVDAINALQIARLEALKKLRQNASDSLQLKKFDQYVSYMRSSINKKILSPDNAKEYTGSYENEKSIIYKEGKLIYKGSSQSGSELINASKDNFLTEEGDVSIRFTRNGTNKINGLVYKWILMPNSSLSKKIN